MSESKHTPGPWEVRNHADIMTTRGAARADGEEAADNDAWTICHYDNGGLTKVKNANWHEGLPPAEADANLRLIAAAPDLLDALVGCLTELEWCYGLGDEGREAAEWDESHLERYRAVLTKARGGS